jgi:hypothetical protein
MSENPSPPFPDREPAQASSNGTPSSDYPTSGEAGCGGAFLFFLTIVLAVCFSSYMIFWIGFTIAAIGLFFRGYRYVFVGFILSALIGVGLLALLLTIFCSGLRNI